MSLLDPLAYDLTTPEGQRHALRDIIDEHNSQFDKSANLNSYQVSAYVQLSVTLVDGNPTGLYTATFKHGSGFPPAVLAYNLVPGTAFYNQSPFIELAFAAPNPIRSHSYFTVDKDNLYFNVFGVSSGGAFDTHDFSAGFYIFNIPAQV